jgi:ERCC4-type nuclease
MSFLLDIFEPEQIEALVRQAVPVQRTLLNEHNFADYFWTDCENMSCQVERKSIDEILSDMDRVEGQLRREIYMAEKTYLLYEGTFESCLVKDKPGTQSFHKTHDKRLMIPGHKYHVDYSAVMAWFDQLDRHGITIIHTIDWQATAATLVALYKSHQKLAEEHTTFKRVIKHKIYPKPQNPQVETLMGLAGAQLGETRATALIEKFGTAWKVYNSSPDQIATVNGIGYGIANRILKSVGRI